MYVADRGNGRIQVFNGDGKYLREIHIAVPYDHKIRPWMGNAPAEIPDAERSYDVDLATLGLPR